MIYSNIADGRCARTDVQPSYIEVFSACTQTIA